MFKSKFLAIALLWGIANIQSLQAQPFLKQTGISLESVTDITVAWGDYDNDGDLDILLTGVFNYPYVRPLAKIYRNDGNNTFSEQTGIELIGVSSGSVAWGDYDNDGNLDIVLTGSNISRIYHNNGDNTFSEQTEITLTGVSYSSVAWGDYDNDGFMDILLTGLSSYGRISKIYHNNKDNTFSEQTGITLTGVSYSSVAWGDYDNDGYLDILLTGSTSSGPISKIYHNNGNNTFREQPGIVLTGVSSSSVAWGNYDNDGYLDILLTGSSSSGPMSKIYHNNGNNTFSEQTGITLTGVSSGSVAWGDYDNDGYLDILLTGASSSGSVSKIYHNNRNNTFSEQTEITLTGASSGSVGWGDYDNDGDLDILLTGSYIFKIYRNETITANAIPSTPSGLISINNDSNIVLKWNAVRTDATPYKAISYNVSVGKTSGGQEIVAPQSTSTGYRKIVSMGNAQLDTTFVLRNLKKGTYYWSVQAIDNSFAGGTFASEQTFVYTADVQASNITKILMPSTSIKLQWLRGNGDKCVVFAKENGTDNVLPVNNTTYIANSSYGLGTEVGTSDWFCIYNGDKNTVTIDNLKSNTSYRFQVCEYSGGEGFEIYNTITSNANPTSFLTNVIISQTDILLAGVSSGSVSWGDYDNDGDLDILLTGSYKAKIYRNDGNNTFTEQKDIVLPGVAESSAAWGDYDNDGYLDIVLTGDYPYYWTPRGISKVYHNNGNNTFTEQTSIALTGVYNSSVVWGDYDNDGYLDILLTGTTFSSVPISKIYHNNGNNTFTEQTGIVLTGVEYSSAAWGDYDNDGDLDILLTGNTSSSISVSKIYRNDGNNTFTEQTSINLTGVNNSSVAWGDYNNDGYLDILLTGSSSSGPISAIYHNNGDNTFSEQTGITLTGVSSSSVVWGDYDNDGYLDILLTGASFSGSISKIYRNNGDNTFSEQTGITLPAVSSASAAWGDYDNDGDIDLLITGKSSSTNISKIFRNEIPIANNLPATPSGLTSVQNSSDIVLKWNAVKTDATPYKAISYNLRVGKTSGGTEIVAPQSTTTGYRKIVSMGNGQLDTTFRLINLKKGTYYWSVQAIDNNFAGGAFAGEQTFVYNSDVQALGIAYTDISCTTAKLQWKRGNGDKCVVFAKENGSNSVVPVNNNTYTANSSYGVGTQVGTTGWFCVYNGDKDSVVIHNLKVNTSYRFQVCEYSGNEGFEMYNISTDNTNPASFTTNVFINQTNIFSDFVPPVQNSSVAWGDYDNDGKLDFLLTGYSYYIDVNFKIHHYYSSIIHNDGNNKFSPKTHLTLDQNTGTGTISGSVAWGDYDNDGDLDILLTGFPGASMIYRNDGNDTFSKQVTLPEVYNGSVAWGDYDNDGYLDILLTGSSASIPISKIYHNNGDNTFSEQTGIMLTGVSSSSVVWGDYNNDGYLDIMLTGYSSSGPVSKIYHNNGDNTFSEQTGIILTGVSSSSVAWGDYDNDGYLDIMITGTSSSGPISKIYHNNGNNTFSEQTEIVLTGVSSGSVAWGDYDNDGDLDILLTGASSSENVAKIYRNNGNNTFSEQTNIVLTGVNSGSVAWGDYDNDGDLDILLTGSTSSTGNSDNSSSAQGNVVKIYRNEITTTNTLPSVPSGLTSIINGSDAILKWNPVKGDATPYKAISYNVRIGTTSGGTDIVTPQSASTGYRKIVSMGNSQLDTTFILHNVNNGKYYWSVQAIDNTFAGGAFASEQTINAGLNDNIGTINLTSVGIKIYPNPVNNLLTVEGLSENTKAAIYTMEGKLVKIVDLKETKEEIFVNDLSNGMYLLKISSQKINVIEKFTKQ